MRTSGLLFACVIFALECLAAGDGDGDGDGGGGGQGGRGGGGLIRSAPVHEQEAVELRPSGSRLLLILILVLIFQPSSGQDTRANAKSRERVSE